MLPSILPTRLADVAFLYCDSLPSSTRRHYDLVKEKIREIFWPKYSLQVFLMNQGNSTDVARLVLEAFPNYDHSALEGEKFRCFVATLDPTLRSEFHEMGAENLKDEASRHRRSPSPAPLSNTEAAPHMRGSVRFQSPERPAHSCSNRQRNFQ